MTELKCRRVVECRDLRLNSGDDLWVAVARRTTPEPGDAIEDFFLIRRREIHTLGGRNQQRIRFEVTVAGKRHPVRFEIRYSTHSSQPYIHTIVVLY